MTPVTPELPAFVSLDEVAAIAGIDREVLRRHLKRRGCIRRIGNDYARVDTARLSKAEGVLYQRLLQRQVQLQMDIEGGA